MRYTNVEKTLEGYHRLFNLPDGANYLMNFDGFCFYTLGDDNVVRCKRQDGSVRLPDSSPRKLSWWERLFSIEGI